MTPMPRYGRVLARCFAIQASWNYERMMGTGFGWAVEPALRDLGDGADGSRYRTALARHSRYFNAHPYFAGLAIGAAVRAEHDGESPERITRLREALSGPLGSIGDRLIWASWLPACAALGVVLVTLGAGAWAAVAFLVLFNVAHVACRGWALRAGWTRGLQVAGALSAPVLRVAGTWAAPVAAFCVGLALPLAFAWQLGGAGPATWLAAAGGALLFALALRLLRRTSGVALATLLLGATWAAGLVWR